MKKSLIITSISGPNDILREYANGCLKKNIEFILIGDAKSPINFDLRGCSFFSLHDQRSLNFDIIPKLPENHYSRKNIGYLEAIKNGAEQIIETDDDNFPLDFFWEDRPLKLKASVIIENGWANIYSLFSDEKIWPRGFPVEFLNEFSANRGKVADVISPVQQGLADDNPDVDAIYRMTSTLPVRFRHDEPVALDSRVWCPFNSQNTTWFLDVFPLLYLPSNCSFRMTDIWRSFIAQRIMWENGWKLLFHSSTVYQERNPHNLLKDFEDEIPGYLNNARICSRLEELSLKSGTEYILDNMIKCYNEFIKMGLIDSKELSLIDSWGNDISKFI